MTTRRFTLADQTVFAALTGDFNPLHVDPIAARRTQFGRPVVHGVHLLLWALENAFWPTQPQAIKTLSCSFRRPVGIDELVECQATTTNDRLRLRVLSRGAVTLTADLTFEAAREIPFTDLTPPRAAAKFLPESAAATARGVTELQISRQALRAAFPVLAVNLPPAQLAFLAATTRIVGMDCPGLHSVYTGLEITPPASSPPGVEWRVQDHDERFHRLTIAARSAANDALITAAFRPPPQAQPTLARLRDHVAPTAYAGRVALVIGGSRGLGELCAKMLAAGGADVCLTYHLGRADADRVVSEINAGGGQARAIAYNVLSPPELSEHFPAASPPTHVYHFTTPPITAGPPGGFNAETFDLFRRHYVDGLFQLWTSLRAITKKPLTLVSPSSIYVEEMVPSLGEYAVAKAAGEALARFIATVDRHTAVKTPRLPRLPTDQTLSLTDDACEDDPLAVMQSLLAD